LALETLKSAMVRPGTLLFVGEVTHVLSSAAGQTQTYAPHLQQEDKAVCQSLLHFQLGFSLACSLAMDLPLRHRHNVPLSLSLSLSLSRTHTHAHTHKLTQAHARTYTHTQSTHTHTHNRHTHTHTHTWTHTHKHRERHNLLDFVPSNAPISLILLFRNKVPAVNFFAGAVPHYTTIMMMSVERSAVRTTGLKCLYRDRGMGQVAGRGGSRERNRGSIDILSATRCATTLQAHR
jgi:hypothetical protein